jgi:APA family basic amino acid/polyamine antiporter
VLLAITLRPRLGVWAALAMIVAEVMGVGIFLTPAGMARTLGGAGWVLGVWAVVGLLSAAGALCYAELGTRFPEAGGSYVFLREAFGERCAFVYGWMSLLVLDPGLTAALGVGLAQYLLVLLRGSASFVPVVAIACIIILSGVSALGVESSARVLRWTAVAKLGTIALLVLAVVVRGDQGGGEGAAVVVGAAAIPSLSVLAGALMGAFFAFGGWWDLGKMSEEIVDPRRTLPLALVGGIVLVTLVYAGLSVAFIHVLQGHRPTTDEAFVGALGAALFGGGASKILAAAVIVAVAGSLAAVLLGAPRVYLAIARSGVFPAALVRFHPTRQSAPRATVVQVALACLLVMLGSFDQILSYFVPGAVFFLGLSAAAILVLPRPRAEAAVFRAPWHPLPIVVFLALVVAMVALFAVGRPVQTLIGGIVIALGVPASWLVIRRVSSQQRPAVGAEQVHALGPHADRDVLPDARQ